MRLILCQSCKDIAFCLLLLSYPADRCQWYTEFGLLNARSPGCAVRSIIACPREPRGEGYSRDGILCIRVLGYVEAHGGAQTEIEVGGLHYLSKVHYPLSHHSSSFCLLGQGSLWLATSLLCFMPQRHRNLHIGRIGRVLVAGILS